MTKDVVVPASEFARNFGRYQDEAQAGRTIRVTSHGREVGGFLSADELAHFARLKRRERQVRVVGDLPEEMVSSIANAKYGE
jgi:prevent-host-death family protein